MSEIKVHDNSGVARSVIAIPDTLISSKRGAQAVHEAVLAHQAALRGGNASTLGKGEVAGSNKKPWKQKGTGRARAGSKRSPVWRGGGIVFGPKPRDYSVKLNKKVRTVALRRAFAERVIGAQIRVVDEITLANCTTKNFISMLKIHGFAAPALVVVDEVGHNLRLAARNVPKIEIVSASDVTAYQLVRFPSVLMSVAAVEKLKKRIE